MRPKNKKIIKNQALTFETSNSDFFFDLLDKLFSYGQKTFSQKKSK